MNINPNCEISSHKSDVYLLYKQISDVLDKTSIKCIPSRKFDYYKEHIAPGFNEHVNKLYDIAHHDFVMCRSSMKRQLREVCLSMNQSKLRFKSPLKYCQQNLCNNINNNNIYLKSNIQQVQ